MNAFASKLFQIFDRFLLENFNSLKDLENIKKFYCFIFLNMLDGDADLLRSFLLGEGEYRPSSLTEGQEFFNAMKPMSHRDLMLKTTILFQAATRIRLALFDSNGNTRVASIWLGALGLKPDVHQMVKLGYAEYSKGRKEISKHIVQNVMTFVYSRKSGKWEQGALDILQNMQAQLENDKREKYPKFLYDTLHNFIDGLDQLSCYIPSFDSREMIDKYKDLEKKDTSYVSNILNYYKGKDHRDHQEICSLIEKGYIKNKEKDDSTGKKDSETFRGEWFKIDKIAKVWFLHVYGDLASLYFDTLNSNEWTGTMNCWLESGVEGTNAIDKNIFADICIKVLFEKEPNRSILSINDVMKREGRHIYGIFIFRLIIWLSSCQKQGKGKDIFRSLRDFFVKINIQERYFDPSEQVFKYRKISDQSKVGSGFAVSAL